MILLLATIGFCYQSIRVSMQFFAFDVMYRVQQFRSREVRRVSINLCFPYTDLLDRQRFLVDTGSFNDSYLTIAQIFKYTPSPDRVLDSCRFRDDKVCMVNADASACMQEYKITKNYILSFICYHVMEKHHEKKLIMELITHAITDTFVIAQFSLFPSFSNVTKVHAVPSGTKLPHRSRDYVDIIDLGKRSGRSGWSLHVSPSWMAQRALPFPYTTKCELRNDSLLQPPNSVCRRECIMFEVGKLGRVPFTEYITDETVDMIHVSVHDMENRTLALKIKEAYDMCYKKCANLNVFCDTVFSTARTRVEITNDPGLKISLLTQRSPDTLSEAVPCMSFIEYFSFVTSCLSTWFGASFLSLRRVRLKRVLPKAIFISGSAADRRMERQAWRRRGCRRKTRDAFLFPYRHYE